MRENGPKRGVHILEDEDSPKPQRSDAPLGQPPIPALIPNPSVVDLMAVTIDLHRELSGVTVEIEHIRPDRMLATESPTLQLLPTQGAPKEHLGEAHALAKIPRSLNGSLRRLHYPPAAITTWPPADRPNTAGLYMSRASTPGR